MARLSKEEFHRRIRFNPNELAYLIRVSLYGYRFAREMHVRNIGLPPQALQMPQLSINQ